MTNIADYIDFLMAAQYNEKKRARARKCTFYNLAAGIRRYRKAAQLKKGVFS